MSSDSEEAFDLDVVSVGSESDSDGFVPQKKVTAKARSAAARPTNGAAAPKAKPTATKSKAGGTTIKGTSGSKKKPLNSKENVTSDEEDSNVVAFDGDDDDLVQAPKISAKGRQKKDASDLYQSLSQVEHILKRPDSYIGSIEHLTQEMWVFNVDSKRLEYRGVTFVPGFFKIFDEILVNAADHKINDPSMSLIKVTIDPEKNEISVHNNGSGIPIEIHKKDNIYIPSMIFGRLLTSSNYDDDEKKLTGGRNGYGAKLTNIYSKKFTVETACKTNSKKFKQTWSENMSKEGKESVTANPRDEEFTKITFSPDLERFGMSEIDTDTLALLTKRVYDLAGTVRGITVWLNGEKIKIRGFKQYVDMFLTAATDAATEAAGGAAINKPTVFYESSSERWEYAFALSESGNFQHVSFANSISTTKGGTHVTLIADQLCKSLVSGIEKKNKAVKVKPAQIKNHMWLFVNSLVENPTFDSQTKEQLTLPSTKFGSKPTLSDDFIKKITKSGIIDRVLDWAKYKSDQLLAKGDKSGKQSRLHGLAKLSDANNAGTKKSQDCTLILTEGDSAKALAEAGLSVVGRDNFGVFPLRGKLLNVREATHDQIVKNVEIQNIKKIMGLTHQKDYKDTSSLRYGSLMIMTDQDHDGSHIKGLLINFLDHFYPSLLKLPTFLVEFVTPIVRVTKGNQKKNFFTIPEYLAWNETHNKDGKWYAKYYKGLGTSTNQDAKEYFSNMDTHMIPFAKMRDEERPLIELAFSKKKADDRKDWLRKLKPGTFIDHSLTEITYDDFINRELILFSMADNIRSIPSVVDGLKPGQRKILFGCFKRNLKGQVKVAQLVGYISEKTAYHHGEQSLTSSIVALAQDYVGSNNINLLSPDGQYGTRFNGGKDAASARYIFTHLPSITRTIFHPHDDPILNYLVDDGDSVEPEWYVPVVPMVLINGAEGIGTGWSTNIPSYNPEDVVANLRRLMRDEELVPMTPWFRGWRGVIERDGDKEKFNVSGVIKQTSPTTVEITELPIHKWTEGYKEFLEASIIGGQPTEKEKEKEKDKEKEKKSKIPERFIQDYKEHHAGRYVHFIVSLSADKLGKAVEEGLVSQFKLNTTLTTSNLICFDADGVIKKYANPEEILKDFYDVRYQHYHKRKAHMMNELEVQVDKLNNQARFVQMIIDDELVISKRKKVDIVAELRSRKFRPFPKIPKAKEAGEEIDAVEDEDEPSAGQLNDFDYLLGMAISSLTQEKVEKLLRERDAKVEELDKFIKVTPGQLWDRDLDTFLESWRRLLDDDAEFERKAGSSTKGKKQATLRTRKSIGYGTKGKNKAISDEDDDYARSAPKAKKAPGVGSTKPAPPRITKPKVKLESDNGMEEDDIEEPKAKTATAKAKSKPPKLLSDEDEAPIVIEPKARAIYDDDDSVPVARPNKGKAPIKRKSVEKSDGSEDELGLKPPVTKKTKAPAGFSATINDFFDAVPSVPKPKAAPSRPTTSSTAPKARAVSGASRASSKPAATKKIIIDSDEEDYEQPSSPPAVRAGASSRRPARAAATSAKAWKLSSSENEESEFEDDA